MAEPSQSVAGGDLHDDPNERNGGKETETVVRRAHRSSKLCHGSPGDGPQQYEPNTHATTIRPSWRRRVGSCELTVSVRRVMTMVVFTLMRLNKSCI